MVVWCVVDFVFSMQRQIFGIRGGSSTHPPKVEGDGCTTLQRICERRGGVRRPCAEVDVIGLARQRHLAAHILGEAAVLRCVAPISAATTRPCGLDLG
jgi:hypothetical protein